MDEELERPVPAGRLAAGTTERVAELSDEAREELARDLAFRRRTGGDVPVRRTARIPYTPARKADEDADAAAAAVRLAAELHATERRIERLERSASRGRYQSGGSSPPSGRYARLLSRADRLERQLRALR